MDETGEKSTNIIQHGYEQNNKLNFLLLITSIGDFGVDPKYSAHYVNLFLKKKQDTVLVRVQELMYDWKVKFKIPANQIGVVLDFQNIPKSQSVQQYFLDLISELKAQNLKVYIKLPLNVKTPFYSDLDMLAELDRKVDLFIVKSFNESVPNKVNENGCRMLVDFEKVDVALEYYIRNANIAPSKLIVETPNFGVYEEKTETGTIRGIAANGEIIDKVNKNRKLHKTVYDSLQPQRSFAMWKDKEDGLLYCFEDSITIAEKIKWMREKYNVLGLATMGLGYNYMGKDPSGQEYYWWPQVQTMGKAGSKIGWMIGGYFFLFASLGYIWSIVNYWEVRNILAKYRYHFWTHIGRFTIFFSIFLLCVDIIPRTKVGLWVCGIIMGFFLLLRLIRRYTSKVSRYGKRYKDKF